MKTHTQALPFQLGEPRSHRGLAIYPLYPAEAPTTEYVGLDEAVAGGLTVPEVDEAGAVELLLLDNPLADRVLLYEGEELVGAKQNRVVERSVLVEAGARRRSPPSASSRAAGRTGRGRSRRRRGPRIPPCGRPRGRARRRSGGR